MIIQHNITAYNSNRQLGITTGLQAKSSEKLSSGYKINRAADDAAGLAISEKMRRQIRGLSQASENVQDGISYVQVADGALNEIDNILARMDELCVQAANDTLTEEDREYINQEIKALKEESSRTFAVTSFNDKLIWDQNTTGRKQIGTEQRPLINWDNGENRYQYVTITDENKGAWPADGSFKVSADNDGATISWKGYDGVSYTSKKIPWPAEDQLSKGVSLSLNSSTMDYSTYPAAKGITPNLDFSLDAAATKEQMISALNGYRFSTSASFPMRGTATSSTGTSYSLSGTMNYLPEITSSRSISDSTDTDHIYPATSNNATVPADLSTMSFTFKIKNGENAVPAAPAEYTATATYNGYMYSSSGDRTEHTRGTWWYEYQGRQYGTNHSYGTQSNLLNGLNRALDIDPSSANKDSLIKDSTAGGTLYLRFSVPGENPPTYGAGGESESTIGYFDLAVSVPSTETTPDRIINDLRNMQSSDLYTTSTNGTPSRMGVYASTPYYDAPIYEGTMLLNIQAGSESTDDNLIPIMYDVLTTYSLGINTLNTLSSEDALKGIEQVKGAARIVDEQRSVFGAYQNRMEHAVRNLDNVVENTQSAESLIRDTDMATEMVKYSNNNILAQAGQAMLAQANQTNQGVLALLQ